MAKQPASVDVSKMIADYAVEPEPATVINWAELYPNYGFDQNGVAVGKTPSQADFDAFVARHLKPGIKEAEIRKAKIIFSLSGQNA